MYTKAFTVDRLILSSFYEVKTFSDAVIPKHVRIMRLLLAKYIAARFIFFFYQTLKRIYMHASLAVSFFD